jgi:DNA-binding transcriptional LysR family regulator
MIAKIEAAAGFTIIDRSITPLAPTPLGRGFLHEARQILQTAREQATAHPNPEEGREAGRGQAANPSAAGWMRAGMPVSGLPPA